MVKLRQRTVVMLKDQHTLPSRQRHVTHRILLLASLALAACTHAPTTSLPPARAGVPLVDHHKHAPSAAAAAIVNPPAGEPGTRFVEITGRDLVAQLDSGGIQRAVILSVAYWYGAPRFNFPDEYDRVRAENDWTARQVAQAPDRLVGFCSISPLRDYAVREIERCTRELHLTGLKMHFGSSRVDVTNPEHLAKVRRVFETANRLKLPIVVHARTGGGRPYTDVHARIIKDSLIAAAPDVPITIAHLWGGANYSASALGVWADAVTSGDPRMKNVWWDVTDIMSAIVDSPSDVAEVVARMRQIGIGRLLWGSDTSPPGPMSHEAWAEFRKLPLTEGEFAQIARNVAPYMPR